MSPAYELHGETAVITLNHPPVNGLSHALRAKLADGVSAAGEDAHVKSIVLIGSERAFSGGADIREFGTPQAGAEPSLHTVIDIIEASPVPVIAAIGGACMGGGLELALACHFRVARADAQIALPEVKLGILPGAGGTQRLPRAIGAEAALNMIVSGNTVPAARLAHGALFDELVEAPLLDAALAFARKVVAEKRPLALLRQREVRHANAEGFFQFARNTVSAVSKNFPAPRKCVDAVAASVGKSFEEGLRVEAEAFRELLSTRESKALRHVFFAERAASKIPDVPDDTATRSIARVGVVGAGLMGGGIVMSFLNAGIPVVVLEAKQEALDKGLAVIRKNYESSLKKGKLTPADLSERMALLTPALSYDAFRDVDLVIEAVFEDMGVKKQVFEQLDAVLKPGAIQASNTSTLNIDTIAGFTRRPEDVLGLHFFSPANVMKLLEVVRGAKTSREVLATAMALARRLKKTAVVAGVCDGFIGNRMIDPYGRQASLLLEEGATPAQVDRALEKFGMAMGPFRMADLAGNDIGWAIRKRRAADAGRPLAPRIADRLCELGRFGQKTSAGWYRYEAGQRDAIVDPAVEELVASFRKEMGLTPRKITEQEIVERCVYALVNEGARILEEKIAQRASDIDLVYLTGYGFPLHRGGPMSYADDVGLYRVVRTMERFAKRTGDDFWRPAPLIARLAAQGSTFNG